MPPITIQPNDKNLAQYYKTIKELRETKQDLTEGNTRRAFSNLLSGLGRRRKLTLIEERPMRSKTGGNIRTDASLVDGFDRLTGIGKPKTAVTILKPKSTRKSKTVIPTTT